MPTQIKDPGCKANSQPGSRAAYLEFLPWLDNGVHCVGFIASSGRVNFEPPGFS